MPNMTKTSMLAAVLAVSSEAFMPPMSATVRPSQMAMKADGSNAAKASVAAVFAAGALFTGFAAPPADAALFTAEPTSIQQSVGFGQPKVDKDPMNNNAASGRTNGNKYDALQQGDFAKKFAAGNAADYGSAKGTDFGPTAGSSPGAATEDTATAGKFQRDAEKPQNQGIVDIAAKKTSDAANVDIQDVSKGGSALVDSFKDAVKGAVGAQSASAPTWGDAKNAASQAKNAVKDTVSAAPKTDSTTFLATGPVSDTKPGAFQFGVVPNSPNPSKAVGVASEGPKQLIKNVQDATKGQGAAAKAVAANGAAGSNDNGVPGSGVDISGKIDQTKSAGQATIDRAGNAASTAASKAEQGVKGAASNTIISGLFDQAGTDQAKSAAQAGGSAVKAKVSSDVNALRDAKPTAEGQSIMSKDAAGAAAQTGQKTVDKVKSDIGAIDRARQNPPFQTSQAEGASSITMAGLFDGKGPNPNADKVIRENTEQVKSGIQALKDAKPSAEGKSIMGGDASAAASKTGQQTVDKVKSDIGAVDNARKNAPFQGYGNKVQDKVDSDINTVKGASKWAQWKAPSANQAGNAIKSKAEDAGNAGSNVLSGIFDSNPVANAGDAASNAGNAAANALKNAKPSAEGQSIMSKDASSAASKSGAKTVDKVKSDIDAVTSGVPSYGGDVKAKAAGVASDVKRALN